MREEPYMDIMLRATAAALFTCRCCKDHVRYAAMGAENPIDGTKSKFSSGFVVLGVYRLDPKRLDECQAFLKRKLESDPADKTLGLVTSCKK